MQDLDVDGALRLAVQLHESGSLAQAEALYRAVLRLQPQQPDALHLLGLVADRADQPEAAADLIGQAIAARPGVAFFHYNLARVLHRAGRRGKAVSSYQQAIALQPDYAQAHDNLGIALEELGDLEAAEASYRRAIEAGPSYAEVRSNLGHLLHEQGRLREATEAYRQALTLKPDYVEALHNLAQAEDDAGQLQAAIEHYQRAIELRPDYAEAHCGLAISLLRQGDLARGWPEYEWRWRHPDQREQRDLPGQPWDGSPLAGRTILLHAEQGFGDTLQFSRYVPLVAQHGGRVILECQPELKRLLASLSGVDCLVARGEVLPPFEVRAPLLSLPSLFGATLAAIPAAIPYLQPPAAARSAWAERLREVRGRKIGLIWSSNPARERRRAPRSIPAAALAPLAAAPNTRLFSLQKGAAADEARLLPCTDLAPLLSDFAEAAAAMQQMDLIVSVDTGPAHLAGALGRPVWLLLPAVAEWRWLLGRNDSPWYPTMRLFRQTRPGEWNTVIGEVLTAIGT